MGVAALSTMTVRPAASGEFDAVFDLLGESVRWLRGQGLDQWSTWHQWRDKMRPALDRGDVWLLCAGDELIGTITVENAGDLEFWTTAELAEPAVYVSKLAVRRDLAGTELGALLLAWAGDRAYRTGATWVRLDAWKTNERLHRYYLDRGWSHLRTAPLAHRRSGALFQRYAAPLPAEDLSRLQEPSGVSVLPSTNSGRPEPDPAGNWQPDHWHQAGGLIVDYEWVGQGPAMLMPWMRYRLVERDGGWKLENEPTRLGYWSSVAPVVAAPFPLVTGSTYVIAHRSGKPCGLTIAEVPDNRWPATTSTVD